MSFQLCLRFSSLARRSHQARVWSAAAWRGSEATSAPQRPPPLPIEVGEAILLSPASPSGRHMHEQPRTGSHIGARVKTSIRGNKALKMRQMLVLFIRGNGLSPFVFLNLLLPLSLLKRLRPTGINGSKDTSCFGFSVANYSALA